MDPVIVATARKHGIHDDDMLHAYRHPTRVLVLDDLVTSSERAAPANCSRSA